MVNSTDLTISQDIISEFEWKLKEYESLEIKCQSWTYDDYKDLEHKLLGLTSRYADLRFLVQQQKNKFDEEKTIEWNDKRSKYKSKADCDRAIDYEFCELETKVKNTEAYVHRLKTKIDAYNKGTRALYGEHKRDSQGMIRAL